MGRHLSDLSDSSSISEMKRSKYEAIGYESAISGPQGPNIPARISTCEMQRHLQFVECIQIMSVFWDPVRNVSTCLSGVFR